jgi:hypothetical protein
MSYLAEPTSKTVYGVVRIGNYIDVIDGIISNPQDLSANASVGFSNVAVTGNLTANGNLTVTSVTPSAGVGITLSNVKTSGYDSRFTITNSGVTQLVAGTGISLSANTGNITISSFGADLINVYGTTTSYTAAADDEYIGVNSANAVTITLPAGPADGRVYIIKDEKGQGSGKITIQPPAGTLIDAKINYVIGVPNQSVQIVYRASGWWII